MGSSSRIEQSGGKETRHYSLAERRRRHDNRTQTLTENRNSHVLGDSEISSGGEFGGKMTEGLPKGREQGRDNLEISSRVPRSSVITPDSRQRSESQVDCVA